MDSIAADRERPALDEAVRRLVETLRPERIYLFGSQARGDADEDSDYDIMVVVPASDRPSYERAQEAYGVLGAVRYPPRCSFGHDKRSFVKLSPSPRFPRRFYGRAGSCMPSNDPQTRLALQWLAKARQDLLTAEAIGDSTDLLGVAAFHCQQAVEKSLKAFLSLHNYPFRRRVTYLNCLVNVSNLTPTLADSPLRPRYSPRTLRCFGIRGSGRTRPPPRRPLPSSALKPCGSLSLLRRLRKPRRDARRAGRRRARPAPPLGRRAPRAASCRYSSL